MSPAVRSLLMLILTVSCTGERAPANDTATSTESPPVDPSRPPRPSTWNGAAGELFAIRASNGGRAIIVNPAFGDAQALDSLTLDAWNPEGASLSMIDGAFVVGTGRVTGLKYDSTCAGWPTATMSAEPAASTWRVAFPESLVDGLPLDSLPILTSADSAKRARAGALSASRLPDDTAAAFRGRPFSVRQANQFSVGPDTVFTMFEVTRLVAQEANPQQEQLLILTEEGPRREPVTVFHAREVGAEETMGSIELLAVLRVRSSGRLALLVRRDRESGFTIEWIERTPRGPWVVRWRSASDGC
jgi:hypothetical protein